MAYNIYKSDGTTVTIVNSVVNQSFNDPAANSGKGLGIRLPGLGSAEYTPSIFQDILQITENFCGASPPSDLKALQGQLWFEKISPTSGNLYVRRTNSISGGLANWDQFITGNTTVIPGSYTAANITVNAQGRITAASNGVGGGSVTSVSVVTANGVSGTVATPTFTPAITLTLGNITPASVAAVGTVTGSNLSGTNTGDQNINGLLPAQAGQAGKFLTTNGASVSWAAAGGGGGGGTVTTVSVTTANGVSGTVLNPSTAPAITLTLGAITPSSISLGGNLTITGASRKIFGDFTNATASLRTHLQTSTVNGSTFLTILPNGTSSIAALGVENNSTLGNNSFGSFQIDSTGLSVSSLARGVGTVLPLNVKIGALISATFDVAGNAAFGGTAALATNATGRFLWINNMPGTPVGVPVAPIGEGGALTGKTPITVDTANNKLYFYSTGAWRDASSVTTPAGANTQVQFNNAGAFGASANLAWDGTTLTASNLSTPGNLTLSGAAKTIIGDFNNATAANRTMFVTSNANQDTFVSARPNGTNQRAGWVAENSSTILDNSYVAMLIAENAFNALPAAAIQSSRRGTGTFLPLSLQAGSGGLNGVLIDINGNVVIGGAAALATSATDRFLYLNSMAGTPSGVPTVPTSFTAAGKVPITVDTANNKLYFYSTGAWRDSAGSVTPGGSNQTIQFNNTGAFGGVTGFTFDTVQGALTFDTATPVVSPGSLYLKATDASGSNVGGQVNLLAGVSATGTGGDVNVNAGYGIAAAANGGSIGINAGGAVNGTGGDITITAGIVTGSGIGGGVGILGGGGLGAGSTGGNVNIIGGNGDSSGGYAYIIGGPGSSPGANGGDARLIGGAGDSGGGAGGWVLLDGGQAFGTGVAAGRVTIRGGRNLADSTQDGEIWFDTSGVSRFVIARTGDWKLGGNSGTSGQVLTSNGSGSAPTWAAPSVTFPLLAPTGSAGAPSYSFTTYTDTGMYLSSIAERAVGLVSNGFQAGYFASNHIIIKTIDQANTGSSPISIQGGSSTVSGNGTPISITAGAGADSFAAGGDISIFAGDSPGASATGGSINLQAGVAASGTSGYLKLTIGGTERLRVLGNGAWSVGTGGTATGTSGQVLTSNGGSSAPTWQSVSASTSTNLAGGATNQIPYQSAASTTVFSSKFTWANSTNVLTVGPANGGSATIRTPVGGSGEDGTSLTVQAGDSTDALTAAGNLTLNAGAGSATIAGGDVTIAGGVSGGSGAGIILFQAGGATRVQINSGSLSSSVLMGYRSGSGVGGAVTQATSRTTGVTLNKASGAITLVSAAGSTTPSTFTVTNSVVTATDVIVVNQKSGTDLYHLLVTNVSSGSFQITAFTTGGTTTEQPVINFAVITGSAN